MQLKVAKTLTLFFLLALPILGQVNTESLRPDESKRGFINSLDFNLNLSDGNVEQTAYNAVFSSVYQSDTNSTFLKAKYSQKEKDFSIFAKSYFIHLRWVKILSAKLNFEIFSQKEENPFINLRDRKLLGLGGRFNLYKKDAKNYLAIGTGAMIENEITGSASSNKLDDTFLKSTNYISLKFDISETTSAYTVTYLQVNTADINDYRFLSEFVLKTKITDALATIFSVNTRFDNQPPSTIKKYDIEINSGLSINF